jgi:anti-sigma B factor antagonist
MGMIIFQIFGIAEFMPAPTKFAIEHHSKDSIDILKLQGFLDAHTTPQLESALGSLIEKSRYNIVVNFRDLDYISSAGLGAFMVFIEDIRSNGGDIKLAEMKAKVFTVFDLLGFPMLFQIVDTEQEAILNFQSAT